MSFVTSNSRVPNLSLERELNLYQNYNTSLLSCLSGCQVALLHTSQRLRAAVVEIERLGNQCNAQRVELLSCQSDLGRSKQNLEAKSRECTDVIQAYTGQAELLVNLFESFEDQLLLSQEGQNGSNEMDTCLASLGEMAQRLQLMESNRDRFVMANRQLADGVRRLNAVLHNTTEQSKITAQTISRLRTEKWQATPSRSWWSQTAPPPPPPSSHEILIQTDPKTLRTRKIQTDPLHLKTGEANTDQVALVEDATQTDEQKTSYSGCSLDVYLKEIEGRLMTPRELIDWTAQLLHLPQGKTFALPMDVYNQLSSQYRGKELVLSVLKATWEHGIEQILTCDRFFLINPETNSEIQKPFDRLGNDNSRVSLDQIRDFLVVGAHLLGGSYSASSDFRMGLIMETLLLSCSGDLLAGPLDRKDRLKVLSIAENWACDLKLISPEEIFSFLNHLRGLLVADQEIFLREAYSRLFWSPKMGYSQTEVLRRLIRVHMGKEDFTRFLMEDRTYSLLVRKWDTQHPLNRQTFVIGDNIRLEFMGSQRGKKTS